MSLCLLTIEPIAVLTGHVLRTSFKQGLPGPYIELSFDDLGDMILCFPMIEICLTFEQIDELFLVCHTKIVEFPNYGYSHLIALITGQVLFKCCQDAWPYSVELYVNRFHGPASVLSCLCSVPTITISFPLFHTYQYQDSAKL